LSEALQYVEGSSAPEHGSAPLDGFAAAVNMYVCGANYVDAMYAAVAAGASKRSRAKPWNT
jgi:hypothetical protein